MIGQRQEQTPSSDHTPKLGNIAVAFLLRSPRNLHLPFGNFCAFTLNIHPLACHYPADTAMMPPGTHAVRELSPHNVVHFPPPRLQGTKNTRSVIRRKKQERQAGRSLATDGRSLRLMRSSVAFFLLQFRWETAKTMTASSTATMTPTTVPPLLLPGCKPSPG